MESEPALTPAPKAESRGDIVFNCPHCAASLVVDAAAAGHTVNCEQCHAQTTVPSPSVAEDTIRNGPRADLQGRLKENECQCTEIISYINQHTIQLARWQLRLQTLDQRKKELLTEIAALDQADCESSNTSR